MASAPSTATLIARRLVEAINSGDLEAIDSLLTDDHRFIDSLGNCVEGRETMLAGWRDYFGLFPYYRIKLEGAFGDETSAILFGSAEGETEAGQAWQIPAAWRAVVVDERVSLWQVYADNKPVYDLLGDSGS